MLIIKNSNIKQGEGSFIERYTMWTFLRNSDLDPNSSKSLMTHGILGDEN